jgi:geranylgeranyl pyrophosphate synthase
MLERKCQPSLKAKDYAVDVERYIRDVTGTIRDALEGTSLKPLMGQVSGSLYGGKMLRSRLAGRVGSAAGVPVGTLVRGGAAIEMLHAASLLHDDVIDGANMRRGAPSFWVSRGTSGSVLVGDLMTCLAFSLVMEDGSRELTAEFINRSREMCEAEVEQELVRRESPDWKVSIDFARRKTGSLFAFVGYLAGSQTPELAATLRECGYLAGTAYQLADDLFDGYGDQASSDKSLGLDAMKPKVTAVSGWRHDRAGAPEDPVAFIEELCARAEALLAGTPAVQTAWREYMRMEFSPSIAKFVKGFSSGTASSVGHSHPESRTGVNRP